MEDRKAFRMRGWYLDTEYGAEECACQHHKKGGKEPGGNRLIDTWVAHLPVVVNANSAENAEDGSDH